MNTNDKQENRFKVYKDEAENKWVIEDTETPIILSFPEGKVNTEGYFVDFKKEVPVMTDTGLIGLTIREMTAFLKKHHKHLLYGKKGK